MIEVDCVVCCERLKPQKYFCFSFFLDYMFPQAKKQRLEGVSVVDEALKSLDGTVQNIRILQIVGISLKEAKFGLRFRGYFVGNADKVSVFHIPGLDFNEVGMKLLTSLFLTIDPKKNYEITAKLSVASFSSSYLRLIPNMNAKWLSRIDVEQTERKGIVVYPLKDYNVIAVEVVEYFKPPVGVEVQYLKTTVKLCDGNQVHWTYEKKNQTFEDVHREVKVGERFVLFGYELIGTRLIAVGQGGACVVTPSLFKTLLMEEESYYFKGFGASVTGFNVLDEL